MTDELPRIAPPRISAGASRASRPPDDGSGAREAHRQTGFLLGELADLVVDGLQLERDIAEASSGARFRKHEIAAPMALWSRAWLTRLQALHAVEWGNYTAAMPLLRGAAELQSSAHLLIEEGSEPWKQWLRDGGLGAAHEMHAAEVVLHPYRAAEIMAREAEIGLIYRAATDLSMGHFGANILLAGEGSNERRVAVTFADRDFHVGLAELVLSWLLQLSASWLRVVAAPESPFAAPDAEQVGRLQARIERDLAVPDRCRIQLVEHDGRERYLVVNWRRRPGDKLGRILL